LEWHALGKEGLTMEFSSLEAFAEHIVKIAVAEKLAEQVALTAAAKVVQREAKAEIGIYQDRIGDIAGWAELADSTKQDRVSRGFTENDPLLRTGELRDSIKYKVGDGLAYVGSDMDIAVYQELGTDKIPPRSFLAGAAMRKADDVQKIVGKAVYTALIGEGVHEGMLMLNTDRN
jgi:phage gpG-like protein